MLACVNYPSFMQWACLSRGDLEPGVPVSRCCGVFLLVGAHTSRSCKFACAGGLPALYYHRPSPRRTVLWSLAPLERASCDLVLCFPLAQRPSPPPPPPCLRLFCRPPLVSSLTSRVHLLLPPPPPSSAPWRPHTNQTIALRWKTLGVEWLFYL